MKTVKKNEITADPMKKQNFNNEVVALQQVTSDHIIAMKDFFFYKDNYLIVFEMISGGSLTKIVVNNHRSYSTEFCKYTLMCVCKALLELHEMKCAHRDIKSDSIHFNKDGAVKISDLGSCSFMTN